MVCIEPCCGISVYSQGRNLGRRVGNADQICKGLKPVGKGWGRSHSAEQQRQRLDIGNGDFGWCENLPNQNKVSSWCGEGDEFFEPSLGRRVEESISPSSQE